MSVCFFFFIVCFDDDIIFSRLFLAHLAVALHRGLAACVSVYTQQYRPLASMSTYNNITRVTLTFDMHAE